MPDQFHLPDFRHGDQPDHNKFNEMVAAIREALHRLGIDATTGPVNLQDFRGLEVADHFLGVTTETPPQGQSAFTDARYWVKKGVPEYRNTITSTVQSDYSTKYTVDQITVPIPEPVQSWQETIAATNLSELPANPSLTARGTHGIPDGTPVHVFSTLSRTSPTLKVYWFVFGGASDDPQYEYQIEQSVAQHKAAWALGPIAHPKIT